MMLSMLDRKLSIVKLRVGNKMSLCLRRRKRTSDFDQRRRCLNKLIHEVGTLVMHTAFPAKCTFHPALRIFCVMSPSSPGPMSQ